jgi:hypothetical protein
MSTVAEHHYAIVKKLCSVRRATTIVVRRKDICLAEDQFIVGFEALVVHAVVLSSRSPSGGG